MKKEILVVEYLIIIPTNKNGFRYETVGSLKNYLKDKASFKFSDNKIKFVNLEVEFIIQSGKVESSNDTFFHVTLSCNSCDSDRRIDEFSNLLKAIEFTISSIGKIQILWNDISLYYSKLAYPLIFNVENLMRKLITKFMVTKIGVSWTKDRMPNDVLLSIKSNEMDKTQLYNYDFIQLSNFLFSEQYPNHKENLIKKVKAATKKNNITLEEIQSLVPTSNWDKHFSKIINISSEDLNKLWEELYKLRCAVAHNKHISKDDYNRIIQLSSEVTPILNSAINEIVNIEISKEEKERLTKEEAYYRYWELSAETDNMWYDGPIQQRRQDLVQKKEQLLFNFDQIKGKEDVASNQSKQMINEEIIYIDKEIKEIDELNTVRVETIEKNISILDELRPFMDEVHPIMIERYIRAERNQYKRQQEDN